MLAINLRIKIDRSLRGKAALENEAEQIQIGCTSLTGAFRTILNVARRTLKNDSPFAPNAARSTHISH